MNEPEFTSRVSEKSRQLHCSHATYDDLVEIIVELEDERDRYKQALRKISNMPNQTYSGISADGEASSHTVVPPNPRTLQYIADRALGAEE